jgi:hypothetical protein
MLHLRYLFILPHHPQPHKNKRTPKNMQLRDGVWRQLGVVSVTPRVSRHAHPIQVHVHTTDTCIHCLSHCPIGDDDPLSTTLSPLVSLLQVFSRLIIISFSN